MLPVDPSTYALYLGVMAVMAITPGPANLFAIATGVQRGPRAALISVAGMNAATLVWYAGAALGLAALIKAFPAVFHVLAIAGGIYVAWLGAKALWRARRPAVEVRAAPVVAAGAGRAFFDGFAVQFANPKIVLFFASVLPPFIDPARPLAPQLVLFAIATIALDVLAMASYGLAGSALSARLREPRFRRAFDAGVGALLLLAAAFILLRR